MDHNDPRLKHGIHVRARLYRKNSAENIIVEGYVIDPKRKFKECVSHPMRWPQQWGWCGIARADNKTWTAEEFEQMTTDGETSFAKLQEIASTPISHHWLHEASLGNLEYLDAGFSIPPKPKNRRGKHHRMRTRL